MGARDRAEKRKTKGTSPTIPSLAALAVLLTKTVVVRAAVKTPFLKLEVGTSVDLSHGGREKFDEGVEFPSSEKRSTDIRSEHATTRTYGLHTRQTRKTKFTAFNSICR